MAYRVIEVIEIVEPRRSAEPQRLFGGFAALTGLFSGLFPQFLHSGFSIIFIVGIALMAILAMVGDYVDGYSLRRSFPTLVPPRWARSSRVAFCRSGCRFIISRTTPNCTI